MTHPYTRFRRLATASAASLCALALPAGATDGPTREPVCEILHFNDYAHGEEVTTLSVLENSLTVSFSALRNEPAGPVPVLVYDTEHWDAGNPPPNDTHNDTQRAIGCNEAANGGFGHCDGGMLIVTDKNFEGQGDDTQGGFITLSGFVGSYEIPSYAAVDSDDEDHEIILRVGAGLVEVGRSSALGDGTVEHVETSLHVFEDMAEFELEGSNGIDDIEICRIPDPFCGDGILDAGEQCDDGNDADGDGCSAVCTVETAGGQGCTPGYWKQRHHFDSWAGFAPEDSFDAVFGVTASFGSKTLLQALKQGGGGEKALGRQAVAAILGASSTGVDYFDTVAGVIARVQEAYSTGNFEGVKDLLDEENNRGCPLN